MKDLYAIMRKNNRLFSRYHRVLRNQDAIKNGKFLLGVSLESINQRVELLETEIKRLCGDDQETFNRIQKWEKEQAQRTRRGVEERLEKEGKSTREARWQVYGYESFYTPLQETVDRGRKETYTSQEMYHMSREEREKVVRSAMDRDSGKELGRLDYDVDEVYQDEGGIFGFCEAKNLLIRDCFGTIIDGWNCQCHEAYLVESKRSDYRGLMGVLYFPFSLYDEVLDWDGNLVELEEDFRLVVLDMELKKAS